MYCMLNDRLDKGCFLKKFEVFMLEIILKMWENMATS